MRLITIKSYSNIFENTNFHLEDFLKTIPKNIAIGICCQMSSIIYTRQDSTKKQLELLEFFLRRQDYILRAKIYKSIFDFEKNEINLFKQVYINEFLLYCIENCKNFEYDYTKIENDLIIFKAYLKIVENFNNKHRINTNTSKEEYFETNIWPIMVTQIKENFEIYPFTPYLKSILFFHYIFEKTDAKESLINYFKTLKQDPINFLNYLMGIITQATKEERSFVLKVDEIGSIFFDKFTFKEFEFEKCEDKNSYLMINPLFKIKDKEYFVFNYNYLCNKLFTGFLYEFYYSLKGKFKKINETKILNLNEYRSFVGKNFTEKYLFRILINIIFKSKFYKVIFDDEKIDSFPDAIILYKNDLIIFEIKDASVHHDIYTNRNYVEIKNTLQNKYGSIDKGTGQIVKFLSKLQSNKYSNFFEKNSLNINFKKLKIHPVIIYTENTFDCPGFMNFLNDSFKSQLNEKFDKTPFQIISRLSFVNLDFIIDYVDFLSQNKTSFLNILKEVNKESLKRKKRLNNHYIDGALEKYHENFQSYFYDIFKPKEQANYIDFLNNELDLISIFKEIITHTNTGKSSVKP